MLVGLGQTTTTTPWGWPSVASEESALQSFVSQYAGWLLLGGLVVLAYATAPKKGRY